MLKNSLNESAKETKKWLKELSWQKIFLVGFIYTVFSSLVHRSEAILTMKYYKVPEYLGVWSKLIMSKAGPAPLEFMATSVIFTLYSGISLALIYSYIRDYLPKLFWKRVFLFADLMIAASFIFFTLPSYILFNIPPQLLLSWFISSFIILVFSSYTFVKIIK